MVNKNDDEHERGTREEMLKIVTVREKPMLVRPRDEDGGDAG